MRAWMDFFLIWFKTCKFCINFNSSLKVLTSLILYQNFCSPKNIRMFLRTVREPSEFGQALIQAVFSQNQASNW